jgi:hypothetical protein|tara:strand:- start:508 stop:654 length:147 start_codon:yes stop_codon:yes gene_type:complete
MKKELIRKLREAFWKVKHARTAQEYYKWQDIVEDTAYRLKKLEFARSH